MSGVTFFDLAKPSIY